MGNNIQLLSALLISLPLVLAFGFLLGHWFRVYRERDKKTTLTLLSAVFDHTHDGVTITDKTGNIIAVNRTFTQVTGYSEAEVIGENPRLLSSGCHDAEFYKNYWQALIDTGIWQGEIWNRRKDGEVYLEWLTCKAVKNNNNEITHFVAVFSDITEHRRQEARLEHATEHDRLTGLPNTASILRELTKSLPNLQRQWCVLLLDIDNFRLVNSSYGFAVGDQLLNNIAKRLQGCCTKGLIARHSADVFIIAAPLASNSDDERLALINSLRSCIVKPFSILGRLMEFSFSVGATTWDNANLAINTVLQEAELALHASKSRGAGQTRFYSEDLRADKNPLAYLQGLREALGNNELALFYQPLVTAATGKIHALEVLLRWTHPVMGNIPPDHFIPLAERHGLMESLGHWILQQALQQYASWQKSGIAPPHIAVNVSPVEFQSENFVANVMAALKKHQVKPSSLELELTEGVFVQQDPSTLEKLEALSKHGINLAIDDFGTGYSSLAYLKHLPVNQLKLDRAFIQGLPENEADRAIVESTLALCRGLKMSVVAEGVENKEQADYLNRKGCDYIQGFFYGRPVDKDQTSQLLIKQKNAIT
ncbi:MAG: EAL domain-containing protein [Pseudomonadaceae bacterium]|nr:EAL domain-containing protein [Pseudomonadaceae bacterium]